MFKIRRRLRAEDWNRPGCGRGARGKAAAEKAKGELAVERMFRNLAVAQARRLKEEIACQPGQVSSKTLAQNSAVSVTLFAFDAGEEISAHTSEGDALVLALEGEGAVWIDGEEHALREGECILMPARYPHAVRAATRFKMLLIVVFEGGARA